MPRPSRWWLQHRTSPEAWLARFFLPSKSFDIRLTRKFLPKSDRASRPAKNKTNKLHYRIMEKPGVFTQWWLQSPKMAAGPKVRAGFILEPVKGIYEKIALLKHGVQLKEFKLTAKRWHVVMERPMARGGDPLTLGALSSSAAAPKTTKTRTKVIRNSIPNP